MSSLIQQCPDPDPSVTRGLTHSLPPPRGSGAHSHCLVIGSWAGQSLLPPPLLFRSHCFLWPISLFLYHCLIRPTTTVLSRPVSHPAVFRRDERRAGWKRQDNCDNTRITCSQIHSCARDAMCGTSLGRLGV